MYKHSGHSRHTSLQQKGDGRRQQCFQGGFPSVSCLTVTTSLWQQLSVWQCTPCTSQTNKVQPPQSAQTDLCTRHLSLPNLAPNLFYVLDDEFSLSDSTQVSDSAVQSLGRGHRACTLSCFTPTTGSSNTTLQNGTCRPWNTPGVASSRSRAEDPQTWGLQHHTATPHCTDNWPQLQGDPESQQRVRKPEHELLRLLSVKITLFCHCNWVRSSTRNLAAAAQEVCSVLSITSTQLRSPPRASQLDHQSHTKNSQLTKPALALATPPSKYRD